MMKLFPNHPSSSHISLHSHRDLVCHQRASKLSSSCFPAAFPASRGNLWSPPRFFPIPNVTELFFSCDNQQM